jgi:excinuclease ABC subunit A
LKTLRDKGNTVIVVEHDAETIFGADWIVDIGPLAGEKGGEILYSGPVPGLLHCTKSLTEDYPLRQEKNPDSQRKTKADKR